MAIAHRRRTKTDQTARNTTNRAMGEWFQRRLDGYHAQLLQERRAQVYRTQPEVRQTGANKAVVVGKGPVDYIAFCADGRTIHFDAKNRAGDYFYTKDEHQVKWLRQMKEWGFPAGWLVFWHEHGECRWHPIDTFENRVNRTDGTPVPNVDWLDIV